MSLTAALQEAYAANPAGEIVIETIELNHSTFDTPARIAADCEDDISLPIVLGGSPVLFKAIPVVVTLPGFTDAGPTPMKISVKNITNYLIPYLRLAQATVEPIEVTYRAYTTLDLTQPGDELTGFRLGKINATPMDAEATVQLKEIEMQAFPLATYDETYYPALQAL